MTKLEAGAIDVRRDRVDVGDAVRAAVARAKKSFPRRMVDISIDKNLPLVRGDATLLEQVVFNLLDNAHKYSGPQSVTGVKVQAVSGNAEIAVRDDGCGIPSDALEKVFDKFYRVAGSDGRAPGSGLGLSICAGLVRGMGGSIMAESPIANGAWHAHRRSPAGGRADPIKGCGKQGTEIVRERRGAVGCC
jgi:two-component system sensor histidine kinase KdpD